MHARTFDLNLLPIFNALLTHGNVSRAAEHLGLTQPAVSHALGRLRRHYKDPLFQRVRNRMEPTERALKIAPSVEAALEMLGQTLYSDFKPAELRRTFRIGLVNYSGFYLLPALTERLCTEAPRVHIVPEHMSASAAQRLMTTKEIDFAVGRFPKISKDFRRANLMNAGSCVILRREHPLANQVITPEILSGLRQVDIPVFSIYNHESDHPRPDYAITCPDLLSVPLIIARSDLVAIVPLRLAKLFSFISGVQIANLSFEFPTIDIDLIFPVERKMDQSQQWLKEVTLDICKDIDSKLEPYYMRGTH